MRRALWTLEIRRKTIVVVLATLMMTLMASGWIAKE